MYILRGGEIRVLYIFVFCVGRTWIYEISLPVTESHFCIELMCWGKLLELVSVGNWSIPYSHVYKVGGPKMGFEIICLG